MRPEEKVTIASEFKIVEFTIPASNGTPDNILNLILAASTANAPGATGAATNEGLTAEQLTRVVSVVLMGEQTDGTERAKCRYSSVAAGTRFLVVEAGDEKEFPCAWKALQTIYLLSNTTSAIEDCAVEVYMTLSKEGDQT